MIEIEKFRIITDELYSIASRRDNIKSPYLKKIFEKDAFLVNRILSASRDGRRFQVSISEDITCVDAFFKTTGEDFEYRLLQVTYPLRSVNFEEAASLFDHWIVGMKTEEWIMEKYKDIL